MTTEISIYGIDRDNYDGRYVRWFALRPYDGPVHHNRPGTTLAECDDLDCGVVATLVVPAGSRVVLGADYNDDRLVLADGTELAAQEAIEAARSFVKFRGGLGHIHHGIRPAEPA